MNRAKYEELLQKTNESISIFDAEQDVLKDSLADMEDELADAISAATAAASEGEASAYKTARAKEDYSRARRDALEAQIRARFDASKIPAADYAELRSFLAEEELGVIHTAEESIRAQLDAIMQTVEGAQDYLRELGALADKANHAAHTERLAERLPSYSLNTPWLHEIISARASLGSRG